MPGAIDNRFPMIYLLDSCRVPKPVADFAREVCLRCRCYAGFNIEYEQLHFYYDDVSAGVLQLEAIRPDGSLAIYQHNVQDIVEYLQMGKIDRDKKDQIEERNKRAEEKDHENRMSAFMAERRPCAVNYAAFLMRQRRGLGQRIFVPQL